MQKHAFSRVWPPSRAPYFFWINNAQTTLTLTPWLFAQQPFEAPNRPKTAPNLKFSRKLGVAPKFPRTSHLIHIKHHRKPHWISTEFPWVFLKFLEFPRIRPNSTESPEIFEKSGEERNSCSQPLALFKLSELDFLVRCNGCSSPRLHARRSPESVTPRLHF